jgi:hypothetical protein
MASTPSIFRDGAGNIREVVGSPILAIGGGSAIATGTGAAAAANVTLTAASGYHWVIDSAKMCVASIAANTAVVCTVTDGTNTLGVFSASANGHYELAPDVLQNVSIAGASGKLVAMQSSSGGTGSTVTLNLVGHKVVAADV